MNRVDRLREKKSHKRKYVSLVLFFLSVVFIGICTADYSINSLMMNQKCIKVISFKNNGGSVFEISLMNKKIHFNIKYIEKDIQNLRNRISDIKNLW